MIDRYGEPDEAAESLLIWHKPGPWKRIIASKQFYRRNFPAPHIDAVESFIDYHVPEDKASPLPRPTAASSSNEPWRSVGALS